MVTVGNGQWTHDLFDSAFQRRCVDAFVFTRLQKSTKSALPGLNFASAAPRNGGNGSVTAENGVCFVFYPGGPEPSGGVGGGPLTERSRG